MSRHFLFILVFGINKDINEDENKSEEPSTSCQTCEDLEKELSLCKETARRKLQDANAMHEQEMQQMQAALVKRREIEEKSKKELENKVQTYKRKMEESLVQVKRYKEMIRENTKSNAAVSVVAQSINDVVGINKQAINSQYYYYRCYLVILASFNIDIIKTDINYSRGLSHQYIFL
jgi:uncharacterized protein (DUF342 family)